MMGLIIGAVLAVVVADALYARARIKLRTRAAQAVTKRPSHSLSGGAGSGGWRSPNEEAGEREVADSPFTGLDRIIGRNNRR